MNENCTRDIQVSIVSHGQMRLIESLVYDLSLLECAKRLRITITLNIEETVGTLPDKYPLHISFIKNKTTKGFSKNHNHAFQTFPFKDERKYFLVLNPDIRIQDDVISPLVSALDSNDDIGAVAPVVKNKEGILEDSARDVPTWSQLFLKLFVGNRHQRQYSDSKCYPDWIAGMFMLFKADTFKRIGGFDEAYFLYYEDVDICSRLWLGGNVVQLDPSLSIVHDARRDSRKKIQYFMWHIASMFRFFSSNVYKEIRRFHSVRGDRKKCR